MDLNNITKIIEIFENSKVEDLELESKDFKIKLSKKIISETSNKIINDEDSVKNEKYIEIKSPIVGTYYCANSPTSKPFVNVGEKIKAGDTICIIEAMKVLNEIKSDVSGTVKEILVKDGELVQFDQVLILVGDNND